MKTTLVLLSILFYSTISAQYTFSTFTEDYSILTEDQNLDVESDWDDPLFTLQIGFDYEIGDATINSMFQDGLGAAFFSGTNNNGNAFGYVEDLRDGVSVGEPSFITYQVDGDVGDRICKIQYANCAFYDEVVIEGTANNRVNFQIWIYEIDNAIEFRFGSSNISDPSLAYLNLEGPNIGIFTDITNDGETIGMATYLSGSPQNPNVETNPDFDVIELSGLNGTPEEGRVYRFAPMSLSAIDQKKESFSIFPTIASEEIWIEGDEMNEVRYSIVNLAGQVLDNGVVVKNSINVSSLSSGMYLINIGETSQKFFKQ